MTKITKDMNGGYNIPAKLANGLLLACFGTMLTVIMSILVWWNQEAIASQKTQSRIETIEKEIAQGILRNADIRLTVVEARVVGISNAVEDNAQTLKRIEAKLGD